MYSFARSVLVWSALGSACLWAGCGSTGGVPTTEVGRSVYSPEVQRMVVENHGGGFLPAPPPGSTCTYGANKYTLTIATRDVAWVRCVGKISDPYKEESGSRTLSEAEFKELSPLLENLKVGKKDGCAADNSLLTVSVTTAAGAQDYVDTLSACSAEGKPLIESSAIYQVLTKLGDLTR